MEIVVSETLYNAPTIYDLEHAASEANADLPYWRSLLDELHPQSVLEMACGTGRLTTVLAEHGRSLDANFRIVGFDISEPFLARARERVRILGSPLAETIALKHSDMRDFDLGERYDLIVVSLNSLMGLREIDDQIACFESVRRHLAPEGRFAIDVVVPPPAFLNQAQQGSPMVTLNFDFAIPDQGVKRFLRFATDRYNIATQRHDAAYIYEVFYEDGRHERHLLDYRFHLYHPRELELLMRCAGLKVVARHGTYNRAAFQSRPQQYLWVMTAEGAYPATPMQRP